MRIRQVSQLKSCGGDDFAPRLHGRCFELYRLPALIKPANRHWNLRGSLGAPKKGRIFAPGVIHKSLHVGERHSTCAPGIAVLVQIDNGWGEAEVDLERQHGGALIEQVGLQRSTSATKRPPS
jgi:hypothetical protein